RASVAAIPGLERLAGNGGDDPARVVDAADRMVVGGVGDVEVVVGVERDTLNSADVGVGRKAPVARVVAGVSTGDHVNDPVRIDPSNHRGVVRLGDVEAADVVEGEPPRVREHRLGGRDVVGPGGAAAGDGRDDPVVVDPANPGVARIGDQEI